MKHNIAILLLLTQIQLTIFAQNNIAFENITPLQGLSAAHVDQVIQDKKGFIWIATANGLNRFDGVDFKVFQHDENDNQSLSGSNIRCILEDSKGNIWAGTLNNGLNKYDYQTGLFTRYLHDKNDKNSISSNEILCLFEDTKGRLWIGTENGLNLFDAETETFTSFLPNEKNEKSLKSKAVITVGEDKRGWIWIGTWDGGLNLAIPTSNPKQFEFRHFLKGDKPTDLKSNHIWRIFLDKEKRLWLGTYAGGLSLMLPSAETSRADFEPTFQTFLETDANRPIANNLVFGLNQDEDGQIWAATVNGLSVFIPKLVSPQLEAPYVATNIRHFKNEFFKTNSLAHNEMRDIYIDREGTVWCSTLGGVSKFDKNSSNFNHFLQEGDKGQNIIVITLMEYDDETVYIGSRPELGLIEYRPKENTFQSYFNPAASYGILPEYISFYKAHPDTLWIGTRTGITYFSPKTKRFKAYPLVHPEGKQLTNLHVRKIIRDSEKRIWLATGAGLVRFDEKKGIFEFFEKDENGKAFPNNDITDILMDNHTLWLATYGGLRKMIFHPNGKMTSKTYLNEVNNPTSIESNRVKSLCIFNNEVWIGTENGLSKYNRTTDDFQNIVGQGGEKISNVVSMMPSRNNRIWLGTREGLIAVIPETSEIIHFDDKDGLQVGQFSLNAIFKNQKHKIFIGGLNGYIRFDSENIQLNSTIPPVYITDVKIYNKSIKWEKDVTDLKTITLNPDQNYFTIEFAALNYTQSSDNQYAYKLEGFNDDWVYCGHQKSVSFSNLDGGTYTFMVKGTNNDGTWNETPTVLKIRVVPPLWKRSWFRGLIFLLVIGLTLMVYSRRVNRVERQKAQLEEQVQLRTTEISNQKHQIQELVNELKEQNEHLEELVKERTKTIERSNLELTRSNEALEQFAYAASHDLQEPLRMISSFATLFARRYKDKVDSRGQEYIHYITDGAHRMSELIKSLLTYSKVGRSDAKFSKTDLNKVVALKLSDLSLKVEEKNAEVVVEDLPKEVLCEPNQIGVVFYNLINNGIKFNTKTTPKVTIKLEKEDETHWTFSVADNGIGIDKASQSEIFEIFNRLHTRTEFEGNGIGLALCKRIILRHEGNIWLESTLGEGTIFYFSIIKKT